MKATKLVGLILLVGLIAASTAMADMVRKVDNFIFLIDTSGSMDDVYIGTKSTKIVVAKGIMERLNAAIPALGYKGGLATAAPATVLQGLETYAAAGYGKSIAKIPTLIGSRSTPLGDGLAALEATLKAATGRNAIIVVSDGQENEGASSLKIAGALAEKYGVCFHTISFADTVNGNQALLDKVTALKKPCGVGVSAAQLADDAKLKQFVKDVFYDEGAVAPKVDPCAADDDGDGVNNCLDKCPGTEKGLRVDAKGCPIEVVKRLKVNFDFDKSDIKPQYHKELAAFAEFAKQYQGVNIEIDGHTDGKGTDAYNMKLSQRRANSVREYLIKNFGMKAERLTAVGFGKSKPIADNNTDAGRAENRRMEAVLKGVYEKK